MRNAINKSLPGFSSQARDNFHKRFLLTWKIFFPDVRRDLIITAEKNYCYLQPRLDVYVHVSAVTVRTYNILHLFCSRIYTFFNRSNLFQAKICHLTD